MQKSVTLWKPSKMNLPKLCSLRCPQWRPPPIRYSKHHETNAKNYICLFDWMQCIIPQIYPSRWNEGLITTSLPCTMITFFFLLVIFFFTTLDLTGQLSFNWYSMYLILFLFTCFPFPRQTVCTMFLPCMSSHCMFMCVYVCVCVSSVWSLLFVLCVCSSVCACGRGFFSALISF